MIQDLIGEVENIPNILVTFRAIETIKTRITY